MFTAPLFPSSYQLEDICILISKRRGKLYKMYGYYPDELIKATKQDGGKPLYLYRIKQRQVEYRLSA